MNSPPVRTPSLPAAARGVLATAAERARRAPGLRRAFGHPLLHLSVRVGSLLALMVGLELWLMRLTHLPQDSYSRPLLALELAARLASAHPAALLTLLALAAAGGLAARYRSLGPRWSDLEHGGRLRALVVPVACVLAWVYATYDYNFFFDRTHGLDRLLVLALAALVYWRPAFVFPFLLALLPVIWQFAYPIGGFSWAAPILLIRVLFLFGAFWLVRTLPGGARAADFVFLLCCLIAAHYWVSGYGKLQLGWPMHDRVAFLLPATYANGWLAFLDSSTVAAATRSLLLLNWPMTLGTLLIECGALVALWRRSTLRIFLVAWIGLHGGIFLLTGIFFWKWMLLNAAVLLLFFGKRSPELPIFTPAHFLLSLVLVGGGALWFRPQKLAWLDARVSYTYRLEALGESGRTYSLPPRYLAPYDYQFTLGAFRYLVDAPRLAITWGATYRAELAAALEHATSPEQALALESSLGGNSFDAGRSATFEHFLRRFVGQKLEPTRSSTWWEALQPPPLLWTFARGPLPTRTDPIRQVVVYEVTSLFDGERYLEIRRTPVRVVELRRQQAPAPPRSDRG